MAVAMLNESLHASSVSPERARVAGRRDGRVRVDAEGQRAGVDGTAVSLPEQAHRLLGYLANRAGQVCSRRAIIEDVFRETFDEQNHSQAARLNTAISRLRERVEQDPQNPKHIMTEGGGYVLR